MTKLYLKDQLKRLDASLQGRIEGTIDNQLARYVIALEDKRFWRHFGVDPIALARALYRYLSGRPNGGASTIDMQYVRTITGERDRTLHRKLSEIFLAIMIRRRFGSHRILVHYLESAYTGTELCGMEQASLALFKCRVSDLDPRRKAMLAATLLSPVPKQPSLDWWIRIVRRANRAEHATGSPSQLSAKKSEL